MSEQPVRILSLDVFRGFTIALMILVNSQGKTITYQLLAHAPWDGCTLADLVFPFFLFIVGLTTVVSFQKHLANPNGDRNSLYVSIIQRAAVLFVLGLVLNAFPYHFSVSTLRVYGILQRIAVCYFFCSILYLNWSVRAQALFFFLILFAYWLLMTQVPVPGIGFNQLTEQGNWVAYFDQLLFSPQRLFGKVYDPEGLLSTLPAIATTLSGVLTGCFLLTPKKPWLKCYSLIGAGLLFLVFGGLWHLSFPMNKNIWTSSFVMWTSGWALIVFSFCYFMIDVIGYKKWALPLKIFGMNALFAFVLHVFLLKVQSLFIVLMPDGTHENLRTAIADYLYGAYSPQNASLFYALTFLLLNLTVVSLLYKKKIFIRI